MKILFFILVLSPIYGLAQENVSLEGVLYKKQKSWHLFVKSTSQFVKKGSVQLRDISENQIPFLIEKSFVKIIGTKKKCKSKSKSKSKSKLFIIQVQVQIQVQV